MNDVAFVRAMMFEDDDDKGSELVVEKSKSKPKQKHTQKPPEFLAYKNLDELDDQTTLQKSGRGRKSSKYVADNWQAILDVARQTYKDEGSIAQTVRHYYYKILSSGVVKLLTPDGSAALYGLICRLLVKAREDRLFPYHAIADPGRRSANTYMGVESVEEYSTQAFRAGQYYQNIWLSQPRYIELWCEKDGQLSFLAQATSRYRVPTHITKGYPSLSIMEQAARRFAAWPKSLLLYVGDFDPAGLDIERYVEARLEAFGVYPEVKRIALTHGQLATLPSVAGFPVKGVTKERFFEQYGRNQMAYEMEAMSASTLLRLIQQTLQGVMDLRMLAEIEAYEQFVNSEAERILVQAQLSTQLRRTLIDGPKEEL
jgi:hypothetical protein